MSPGPTTTSKAQICFVRSPIFQLYMDSVTGNHHSNATQASRDVHRAAQPPPTPHKQEPPPNVANGSDC
eukprot:89478-Amphidinium_carterae.1